MRKRALASCVWVVAIALAIVLACGGHHGNNGDGGNGGDGGFVPDGATCPTYQINCNNMCTSTSDPHNCGACGVTCTGGQVCSAGGCAGSCLTGLDACGGTCVDLQSDDANCGTCGHMCGSGQGCVGGTCQTATVFPPPAMCAGGGPPPNVGSGSNSQTCAGGLGATSFTWSVCSCNNALMTDNALLDGWNSANGPYMPGQLGGGLGANKTITSDSVLDVWGAMWAAATTGTSINTQASTVYDSVESGNDVSGATLDIKHDAYVAGNISGATIAGTLFQPTGKSHGGVTAGAIVNQPVTVPPPCDCTSKVPVAGIVAYGKTHNDNAMIGLDPAILTGTAHPARIDLPCGEYYLSGVDGAGDVAIVVHGKTVVFIDSSINSNGFLTFTIADSSSQLDVFVNGTMTSGGTIRLGDPNWPALTRIYLATANQFELSSAILVSGNIWVGNGKLLWTSDSDMFGSIFANDFEIQSRFNIHYDQSVVNQGSGCTPPTGCTTCKDCNNQACNNGTCGACQSNADCCSPLICQMGMCVPFIP